jgi:acyl-coenzyme A synthetase/AMP-(fatty) acid ligase
MSHRNSAAAVVNMLLKTECHRLLTTPKGENIITDALMDEIRGECPPEFTLSIEDIPRPDYIFPQLGNEFRNKKNGFEAYPSKKRLLDDVAVYLHSSGSTGFPKPVPQTFKTLLLAGAMGKLA